MALGTRSTRPDCRSILFSCRIDLHRVSTVYIIYSMFPSRIELDNVLLSTVGIGGWIYIFCLGSIVGCSIMIQPNLFLILRQKVMIDADYRINSTVLLYIQI